VTSNFNKQNSFDNSNTFMITAEADNELDSEGDTAQVFASAKTSDGAYIAMKKSDLNVSSSVLTVSDLTTLTVPIGAAKVEGCNIVKVAWWSCGFQVASNNPYVLVNMPAVTSVTVAVVRNEVIFFKSDPLATAPVNRPTSTKLRITVKFENNQQKDFSTDKRASLKVEDGKANLAEVYNLHYVRTPTASGTPPHGQVTITASLGSYAPGKTGTVTLKVDRFKSLALSSAAYPYCSNSGCAAKTTINRLPGGGAAVFQRVKVSLRATSEYGSTFNVGLGSTVSSVISDRTVINLHNNDACSTSKSDKECTLDKKELEQTPLVGLKAGKAKVTSTWAKESAVLDLEVKDTVTPASKVQLLQAEGSTVTGLINSKHSLRVSTEFADKTSFTSDAVSSWYGVSNYLSFESTNSAILSVDSKGVMTLKGNSPGANKIIVSVKPQAGTASKHARGLYANLQADLWDMDIEYGNFDKEYQFPSRSGGQTFDVTVLINSGNKALKSFQFELAFDPDVLRIASDKEVSRGLHWAEGDFSATANSPVSKVLILGNNVKASRTGKVQVAKIRFTVQKNRNTDKTAISGLIIVTEAGSSNAVSGAKKRAVVAGAGQMWAQGRRGRQLLPATGHADPAYSSVVVHTRRALFDVHPKGLKVPSNAIRGDLNLDGDFTVSDLTFLKSYMLKTITLDSYPKYREHEMDPQMKGYTFTGKSGPDVTDVGFFLNALAKKKRFLVAAPSIEVKNCVMTVTANFVDDARKPT
jgi:hypothetical protein